MTPRTVGVEEEFLLVDARGTGLADVGEDVVGDASRSDSDAQYEHELKRAQAELASRPTASLAELGADLSGLRDGLVAAASARGVRVVASGTNPTAEPARTTVDERYQRMNDRFGQLAQQQLVCGMHVHVGVASPDEGVAVIDALAPWLPVLTALASNSPFHAGRDTGYASYRRSLWGQWPSAGPTAPFATVERYRRTLAELVATGAAVDEQMVYFDARLSPRYPTVEIRCCDVGVDVADAVRLAAIARGLVSTLAADGAAAGPAVPVQLLRAASWRAARFGMGGELVGFDEDAAPRLVPAWALVDELVALIGPALEDAGDLVLVQDGLADLRRRGTGADLQRAAAERGGMAAALDGVVVRPTRSP